VLTASRRQRRHREVGSEGSPRQSSDPRNTNRIRGWAAWMSRLDTVKSDTTKGLSGKCGGARAKAAVLIRGDLIGCRRSRLPTVAAARWRRTGQESAAAIVPAGIEIAGKGQTSVRGSDRTDSRSVRDSHVRWCGRGWANPGPYPILPASAWSSRGAHSVENGGSAGRLAESEWSPLVRLERAVVERPFCGKLGGTLGGETPSRGTGARLACTQPAAEERPAGERIRSWTEPAVRHQDPGFGYGTV
jgi:hypothetical protein